VPFAKRKACFRCSIAIAQGGRIIGITEGKCIGRIGFESKGRAVFGYDPLFVPNGYKKTFAQIGIKKQNRISHRSKALSKAKKIIKRYVIYAIGLNKLYRKKFMKMENKG